jgi:hypothetical protein
MLEAAWRPKALKTVAPYMMLLTKMKRLRESGRGLGAIGKPAKAAAAGDAPELGSTGELAAVAAPLATAGAVGSAQVTVPGLLDPGGNGTGPKSVSSAEAAEGCAIEGDAVEVAMR